MWDETKRQRYNQLCDREWEDTLTAPIAWRARLIQRSATPLRLATRRRLPTYNVLLSWKRHCRLFCNVWYRRKAAAKKALGPWGNPDTRVERLLVKACRP
jgi:hypothetical protein